MQCMLWADIIRGIWQNALRMILLRKPRVPRCCICCCIRIGWRMRCRGNRGISSEHLHRCTKQAAYMRYMHVVYLRCTNPISHWITLKGINRYYEDIKFPLSVSFIFSYWSNQLYTFESGFLKHHYLLSLSNPLQEKKKVMGQQQAFLSTWISGMQFRNIRLVENPKCF